MAESARYPYYFSPDRMFDIHPAHTSLNVNVLSNFTRGYSVTREALSHSLHGRASPLTKAIVVPANLQSLCFHLLSWKLEDAKYRLILMYGIRICHISLIFIAIFWWYYATKWSLWFGWQRLSFCIIFWIFWRDDSWSFKVCFRETKLTVASFLTDHNNDVPAMYWLARCKL